MTNITFGLPSVSSLESRASTNNALAGSKESTINGTSVFPKEETHLGVRVSAEAQYLFEVSQHLSSLSDEAQDRTLALMRVNENKNIVKAANHFNEQQAANFPTPDKDEINRLIAESTAKAQKIPEALASKPLSQFTVLPPTTQLYRLDGPNEFNASRLSINNPALNSKITELEKAVNSELEPHEARFLVSAIRDAVGASEHETRSIDEVVHLQYTIEKASATIAKLDISEALKKSLHEVLDQRVSHQLTRQEAFLRDTELYLKDDRLNRLAGERLRADLSHGTAAKEFNQKLTANLAITETSIFDADDIITELASQSQALGTPTQPQIKLMLDFYQHNATDFQRLLDKVYVLPQKSLEIDTSVLDAGHHYALKVIEEISGYGGN